MKSIPLKYEPRHTEAARFRLPSRYAPTLPIDDEVSIQILDDDVDNRVLAETSVKWSRAYVHPDDDVKFKSWIRETSYRLGLDHHELGLTMRIDLPMR